MLVTDMLMLLDLMGITVLVCNGDDFKDDDSIDLENCSPSNGGTENASDN